MADEEHRRFDGPEDFRTWLEENQDSSTAVWIEMAKKGSGQVTVTYAQALDVALAYGWIDGQARSIDDNVYKQRFTPRRPKSPWSAKNVRAAEEMIAADRMKPRGLVEVDRARADGRWERAYEGSKNAEPHPDFLAALAQSPEASAFFDTLNSQSRFLIYYRIHQAQRPETRARRIETFVEKLARGEEVS